MRVAAPGFSRIAISARAIAPGSPGGTSSPVTPGQTSSSSPSTPVATTGSPAAIASRTAIPSGS